MRVVNGFGLANIVTAFNAEGVIGSKVLDHGGFTDALRTAVQSFDWTTCRTAGQGFIPLNGALHTVSSGEARIDGLTDADLVARVYRGVPSVYVRREKAAPATSLAVIVYTAAAYNADPDTIRDGDFTPEGVEYVVVAVLASAAGPGFSATRLVHNLAGGNRDFIPNGETEHDLAILARVVSEAKKTDAYMKEWAVVCG